MGKAHDGIEAQRLIAELHPDVLLLDLVMPDLRPAKFVRWSRANCPATEVLPLSAHDRDCYLDRVVEVGAAGFVTKDEAAENLVAAIRRAVRGEVLFSREQLARAGPLAGGGRAAVGALDGAGTGGAAVNHPGVEQQADRVGIRCWRTHGRDARGKPVG